MARTQISLDKNSPDERLPVRGEGAWMKYAGFVATGDPHSSQSIDETVYGGFIRKTRATPQEDLALARKRKKELEQ